MIASLLPLILAQAAAAQAVGQQVPDVRVPSEIVASAPAADWVTIAADDLLVMDLAPDAAGRARRVTIQLIPAPFSAGWVANVRMLATAHWWDGTSVNRVQDNYVAQWGDASEKKPLLAGLRRMVERDYVAAPDAAMKALWKLQDDRFRETTNGGDLAGVRALPEGLGRTDSYAVWTGNVRGWPLASDRTSVWPVHCYGMVGVGRDLSPDTGSGAELYAVIGQAPRHLDRNIALVGRIVEGIEHLSSLPRGTEALGLYKNRSRADTDPAHPSGKPIGCFGAPAVRISVDRKRRFRRIRHGARQPA